MNELEAHAHAVQKSNKLLVGQIIAVVIIFMIQLFIMTNSIRSFMGGDAHGLWPAALFSLFLFCLSFACLLFNRVSRDKSQS